MCRPRNVNTVDTLHRSLWCDFAHSPHEMSDVRNVAGSTQKICQLIREVDNGHGTPLPVSNHTEERAHLSGTDLGVSFPGPASRIEPRRSTSPCLPGIPTRSC
jgi:hypothetical protein